MVMWFLSFLSSELVLMFFIFLLSFFVLSTSTGLTFSYVASIDMAGFVLISLTCLIFFYTLLSVLYEKSFFRLWDYLCFLYFCLFMFLVFLFSSINLSNFYLFFELTIIPTFIFIAGWGYSVNRLQACFYMVIYMLMGSYPLLLGFFHMYDFCLMSDFFLPFYTLKELGSLSIWWFFLLLVFMVKLPVFLLHLWLPKAHVDAPLLGSMILAGVLLKMGGFGVFKISFLLKFAFFSYNYIFPIFALVGAIFVCFLCIRQFDMKSLVAYSSVVHMGAVLTSFFLLSYYSLISSFMVMVSHGICSCGLFFLVNSFYKSLFSRSIFVVRGVFFLSVVLSYLWSFFCFVNMGCPPFFNFFSEIISVFSFLMYGSTVFYIIFALMVSVGFYCVLMMMLSFHGSMFIGPIFRFSLNPSELCVAFIFSYYLSLFLFYIFMFVCHQSSFE